MKSISGFEKLARNFHKEPGWRTLILIGRDNLWVHETKARYTTGRGADEIAAVQTPLGRTLVGPKPLLTKTAIPIATIKELYFS